MGPDLYFGVAQSFPRLRSCMKLIACRGGWGTEPTRWWRRSQPLQEAERPRRVWWRPVKNTRSTQRWEEAFTIQSHSHHDCLVSDQKTSATSTHQWSVQKKLTERFLPAEHVCVGERAAEPAGKVPPKDERYEASEPAGAPLNLFTCLFKRWRHCVFSFSVSSLSGLAGFARLCAGDQYEVCVTLSHFYRCWAEFLCIIAGSHNIMFMFKVWPKPL